jgi:hypothetical protein
MKKEEIRTLMLRWQSQLLPEVGTLVSNLFDVADGVLMEYADKAESNEIQSGFIDGQRELWRKKDNLLRRFNENFERELFVFLRPVARPDAPGAEVLSLVSKDAFERSLALKTISEQAIKNNPDLYYALSQRLGVVSGSAAIPYEDLPAGPYQLAKVFEGAASMLTIERRVLLTLYTLFEREVIRESPRWHHELNEALRERGILPHLRYELKLDPRRGRSRPASQRDNAVPQPAAGQTQVPPRAHGAVAGHGDLRHGAARRPGFRSPGMAPRAAGTASPALHRAADPAQPELGLPRYTGGTPAPTSDQPQARQPAGSSAGDTDAASSPGGLETTGAGDPLYSGAGEGTRGLGDELLGRIRDLLVAQRTRRLQTGQGTVRPDPVHPASPAAVAAAIDSRQIQQDYALPETGVFQDGIQRVVVPRDLLEKLRVALATQRTKIKESVGEDQLSHFDEDTIDIVGMLFEVMLNDERLNNTVKALLSHLHTPYLKLAVRDKAFLRNRQHAARQLLDNMVEAGSRWVDERDLTRGIYPRLQRIVDLVMKAGDHPIILLQELNAGLAADIRLRSERQQVREVRTVEAEKGKARLEDARVFAARTNRRFLKSSGSPAPFQEFINGPWTDYMTLLYLRSNGNTESAAWQGALSLGLRLTQSVEAASAGRHPSEAVLAEIRRELTQRLGEAIPHYQTKVDQLFEIFAEHHEISIVAPAPLQAEEKPVKVELSVGGTALMERLPKLPSGSWLVFHETGGDRVVKLSWFNPKTERFLFVDQAGAKALVVPLKQLADRIDRERAHVLLSTGASYVESSLERALNALSKRSAH